ncbi:hypothetical protein QAD02_005100 [Eretmocerus hayati]|uniref:Uncharacterized protein n=1 Tax=Eretmocerus hayati TaxID=131215 RepID=A0ACC2NRK2_9HYME|nr:hypothetical protein QAD02_005100 [Eretmocerus hayati]
MYHCRLCSFQTPAFNSHLKHHSVHRNICSLYHCGFNGCEKLFQNEANLRRHVQVGHEQQIKIENPCTVSCTSERGKFLCTLEICQKECDTFSSLIKHLKSHLRGKEEISCPFRDCKGKYTILTSFTSHLTKKHRRDYKRLEKNHQRLGDETNIPTVNETLAQSPDTSCSSHEPIDFSHLNLQSSEQKNLEKCDEEDLPLWYLKNLAHFHLKLETELLLPISTIQKIISEICVLHQESQDIIKKKLSSKLVNEGIVPERVNEIIQEIFEDDLFIKSHEILRSDHMRKKFYKSKLDHVEPVMIDVDGGKTSFAYIPVSGTLKGFANDKSMQHHLRKKRLVRDDGVLRDFKDGDVYRKNKFFEENPDAFEIILYSDAFEIANPIGPSKKKHKILAFYMTLGNLPDHLRCHTNSMKLVALCKEKDFNHDLVLNKIIKDLSDIESEGVEISKGKIVKGSLVLLIGDNLGSHSLGGFVANFSTLIYFCRFCLLTRKEFHQENGCCNVGAWRTKDSYVHAINCKGKNNDYEGVKFDSAFNKLKTFHVCNPGLPPCIGHDLIEGFVAYDVKLFIDYFVDASWFSLNQLNSWIKDFPYSTEDMQDKPCDISDKKNRLDDIYHVELLDAINKSNLSKNLQECNLLVVKGTEYKKGYVLAISQDGYQNDVKIAKICLFLSDNEQNIHILFEVLENEFLPHMRSYRLGKTQCYECLNILQILNFKPMSVYRVNNMLLAKQKYGFVATPL